jgi:hypothetical protein
MHAEREKRSGGRRAVKRGASGFGLAVAVALVAVALAAAWMWTRDARPAGSVGPMENVAESTATAPGSPSVPDATHARSTAGAAPVAKAGDDPERFRGRGRIRGEIVKSGVALPGRWTLVLEPHPTLVGSETAERRRVELERGETTFDVGDLPLGGYRVRAVAPGLNSVPASVLLVRGSSDVFVSLRFAASGLVDGFVLDDAGAPAEGVRVTIEDQATHDRESQVTDAGGGFLFRGIVDGEYTIRFGDPESPLVLPGAFTFRAPTLRWRETRLPPTGSALVRVRDAAGRAVPEAEVLGSASPSGVLRGRADADGVLEVRWLIPGRYALTANAPDRRTGRALVAVEAGKRAEVVVAVE